MYRFSFLILGLIVGGILMSNLHLVSAQFIDDFIDSFDLATDPDNGECLTTDGTNNVWSSSCGGGGGSNWTIVSGGLQTATTTDFARASYFTASSTSATSTFPIIANNTFRANTSAGVDFDSSNGTHIANLGVGSSANSVFYGGVNIDGTTRLATSINGVLQATAGAVTATTTGTLTENVTGLEFDATRALIGGSAILSLTSGYAIPTTTDFTNWNTAYASTTALTPSYIRGLFSNTATGLTYTGATGITALTAGYNIPLSASTTNWNGFYDTPSTRITAGTGLSWAGNTLSATGGTGSNWTIESGGLRTSTTTDFAQANHFVATSTTGISTFAGQVAVNGATTNAALNVKTLASSNQAFQTQMTNTTDIAFSTYNTGDSFTRFSFLADGTMKWGSGTFVGDVGLNRSASGTLSLMPYGSATSVFLGIGTSTPVGKLSVVGTSGGTILQLLSDTGTKFMEMLNTGVTTLLGTWDFSGATVKQHVYSSFTWPSTATTTSATTTMELGKASTAESWSNADCYVTSGTGAFIFTDGTNRMNGTTTDSVGGTHTLSTNNTFTAKEKRFVEIGPLTNAKLVCTVDRIVNN